MKIVSLRSTFANRVFILFLATLSGCATSLPPVAETIGNGKSLVVGRTLTIITGARERKFEAELRSFELINSHTNEWFLVEVKPETKWFYLALTPGSYELTRIQVSEGPFLSMAQLSASFSVEEDTLNYLGTWRFGVDSPRYGRMVALSIVEDEQDRADLEQMIDERYSAEEPRGTVTALPLPANSEARLYEVMPYPRNPSYFRRHLW